MTDKLPFGTRVRFKVPIIDRASGDHPEIYHAGPGDTGVVVSPNPFRGYWVEMPNGSKLNVGRDEVEPIQEVKHD